MNSLGAVDIFAEFMTGPALNNGQVPDEFILRWANSTDHLWRRTAHVCTIPLNRRSVGGQGDIHRTLIICHTLVANKNDMVIKALSWALRELVPHDPESALRFFHENEGVVVSHVKTRSEESIDNRIQKSKAKGSVIISYSCIRSTSASTRTRQRQVGFTLAINHH